MKQKQSFTYLKQGRYTFILVKAERQQCMEDANFLNTGLALHAILPHIMREKVEDAQPERKPFSYVDKSLIGTTTII